MRENNGKQSDRKGEKGGEGERAISRFVTEHPMKEVVIGG